MLLVLSLSPHGPFSIPAGLARPLPPAWPALPASLVVLPVSPVTLNLLFMMQVTSQPNVPLSRTSNSPNLSLIHEGRCHIPPVLVVLPFEPWTSPCRVLSDPLLHAPRVGLQKTFLHEPPHPAQPRELNSAHPITDPHCAWLAAPVYTVLSRLAC